MLVWGVCYIYPAALVRPEFSLMVFAWSLTEVFFVEWMSLLEEILLLSSSHGSLKWTLQMYRSSDIPGMASRNWLAVVLTH